MDSYGLYKKARDAVWQCLINNNAASLPVNLIDIAIRNSIKVIKNSEVGELSENESGAAILRKGKWYIVYDDNESPLGRRRFTIAHELGHIFLGHLSVDGYYGRIIDPSRPTMEREADMFAARLLAPACVLWGLGLSTAEEIAAVCKISMQAATIRAERMQVLRERNKFLSSPLERRVYEQFGEFIKVNKHG